jgi:hypothetical protein
MLFSNPNSFSLLDASQVQKVHPPLLFHLSWQTVEKASLRVICVLCIPVFSAGAERSARFVILSAAKDLSSPLPRFPPVILSAINCHPERSEGSLFSSPPSRVLCAMNLSISALRFPTL